MLEAQLEPIDNTEDIDTDFSPFVSPLPTPRAEPPIHPAHPSHPDKPGKPNKDKDPIVMQTTTLGEYKAYFPKISTKISQANVKTEINLVDPLEAQGIPKPDVLTEGTIKYLKYDYTSDAGRCNNPTFIPMRRGKNFHLQSAPDIKCMNKDLGFLLFNEPTNPVQDNLTAAEIATNIRHAIEEWNVTNGIVHNDIIHTNASKNSFKNWVDIYKNTYGENPKIKAIGVHIYLAPMNSGEINTWKNWVKNQIVDWEQISIQKFGQYSNGKPKVPVVVTEFGVATPLSSNNASVLNSVKAIVGGMDLAKTQYSFFFSTNYPNFSEYYDENGNLTTVGQWLANEMALRNKSEYYASIDHLQNQNPNRPGYIAIASDSGIYLLLAGITVARAIKARINRLRQLRGQG